MIQPGPDHDSHYDETKTMTHRFSKLPDERDPWAPVTHEYNFRIVSINKQTNKQTNKYTRRLENGNQGKKREEKNFEFVEKDLLIDYAGKNRTIIETKLTKSVTVSRNRAVWRGIGAQINAIGFAQRSVPEIKNKWSNIVQKRKRAK